MDAPPILKGNLGVKGRFPPGMAVLNGIPKGRYFDSPSLASVSGSLRNAARATPLISFMKAFNSL